MKYFIFIYQLIIKESEREKWEKKIVGKDMEKLVIIFIFNQDENVVIVEYGIFL